jgi:hypothetical protein
MAVAVVATQLMAGASTAIAKDDDRDPIEGAFNATVTIKNCSNGAVLGSTRALLLFHHGGTVTIDNTQAPTLRGLILGTWVREGVKRYTSDVSHFNHFEDGTFSGVNKIHRTIVLGQDADTFAADLRVQVFGVDGTLLAEVCPTEAGTRVAF